MQESEMQGSDPFTEAIERAEQRLIARYHYLYQQVQAASSLKELDEIGQHLYEERITTIDRSAGIEQRRMNLWIASHNHVRRWLYMGGSAAWFEPDSHYVFFDPIPKKLLPKAPDLLVWWLIYHEDYAPLIVCKIALVPSSKAPRWADL